MGFGSECEVESFCDESSLDKDSTELEGEVSLFASLIGLGMSKWVESEKRMKSRM